MPRSRDLQRLLFSPEREMLQALIDKARNSSPNRAAEAYKGKSMWWAGRRLIRSTAKAL
jgi:hypothetical protein